MQEMFQVIILGKAEGNRAVRFPADKLLQKGIGVWRLGSRWNAEREQAADCSAAKKEPRLMGC
ncbi:MAG: hypothetical protein EBU32_13165 [Opitutaceae bacterium]|nr:hypothetical protein [Opitutaceae bacterium]